MERTACLSFNTFKASYDEKQHVRLIMMPWLLINVSTLLKQAMMQNKVFVINDAMVIQQISLQCGGRYCMSFIYKQDND